MKYYEGFAHTNTTDVKEILFTITSSEEEVKTLNRIVLTQRVTNDTLFKLMFEREEIIKDIIVAASPMNENPYVIDVAIDIPLGQTITGYITNRVGGSNGGVIGYFEYQITE